MSGSLDNEKVLLIDTSDTLFTALIWPDGKVQMTCRVYTDIEETQINHRWVVEILMKLVASEEQQAQAAGQ